jgi:hypothetical protein
MKLPNVDRVNTVAALKSIEITSCYLSSLAGEPQGSELLKKYGINPSNYHPKLLEFIPYSEWINLVIFYAERVGYAPARRKLKIIKKTIATQQPVSQS